MFLMRRSRADLGLLILYLSLLVLTIYPIYRFKHFPTQDGPSHLYNAVVVAEYAHRPIYREYFQPQVSPAGNVLSELLLVGLVTIVPPHVAETLLLTSYCILFPLSVGYLLQAVSDCGRVFSLVAFVFTSNLFLHLGFWNFCLSIPLACTALGFYLKHREAWTPRSFLVFGFLTWLVYMAHIVSWAILLLAIAFLAGEHVWYQRRTAVPQKSGSRSRIRYSAVMGAVFLGMPGVFAVMFLLQSVRQSGPNPSEAFVLQDRLWTLYSGFILYSGSAFDGPYGKLASCLLAIAVAVVVVSRGRQGRTLQRRDIWLLLSGIMAIGTLLAKDSVIGGGYLRVRLVFYVWLFLLVWLSTHKWQGRSLSIWAAGCVVLTFTAIAIRLPEYAYWNRYLEEMEAAGRHIQPGSTVLALRTEKPSGLVNPDLHAAGILTPEVFIDLHDYEAMLPYFTTHFRADRSPAALGGDLDAGPPVFSVERYRALTGRQVDYILFAGKANRPSELALYPAELSQYRLVFPSERQGRVRLYRRIDGGTTRRKC